MTLPLEEGTAIPQCHIVGGHRPPLQFQFPGESISSRRKHHGVAFFDQGAIAQSRLATRQARDTRQFAGNSQTRALQKTPRKVKRKITK